MYSTVRGSLDSLTFDSTLGTLNALLLFYWILNLLQPICQTQGLSEIIKWKKEGKNYIWHIIKHHVHLQSQESQQSFFSPAVFSYEYDCLKGQFAQNKNSVTDIFEFFFSFSVEHTRRYFEKCG